MNSMASLAFVFSLRAGKTEEWRAWIAEILGPRRSEYEAFSRRAGLRTQRAYLQHTPQGDQAIIYLEGDDLQRTFQHLRTAQDQFTVWVRQRTKDVFDGVDLTQIELGSLSDANLVPSAVAGVLRLGLGSNNIVPESVAQVIGDRKLLLVLDGFERELRAYSSMSAAYQGDAVSMDPHSLNERTEGS